MSIAFLSAACAAMMVASRSGLSVMRRASPRPVGTGGAPRSPPQPRAAPDSGSGGLRPPGGGEPGEAQDLLRLPPGRQAVRHVAADDEGQGVLRSEVMQCPQGPDREGCAAALDLDGRDGE